MNSISIHIDNEWHKATPHVNVDGVWLKCKAVYVKADNVWRKVYQHSADILIFPTRRYLGDLQDVRVSAA